MKKTILAVSTVAALSCLPGAAFADLAFNVGAVTDYRYRGISQSRLQPALQGGVDWSQDGFYVGTWASTIRWIKDFGGDSDVEIDIYGGYKGDIIKETLSYDVGVLTYQYPSNKLSGITGETANTTEVYGALTYGPATLKYSHVISDGLFGAPDSKNGYYLDLSASFDVGGGIMLAPHIGHQRYRGPASGAGSYWDGSLTLSKDFNGIVPSIALIANRRYDAAFYTSPYNGKNLARSTVVVGVKYNF